MTTIRRLLRPAAVSVAALTFAGSARAQTGGGPVDPRVYSALTWRNLGPFRGGRVAAVSGAIGQPGVFYIGLPAAGVWKTTSAGQTWFPIFDAIKDVSSIGSVDVAPSDPNIIYVGTGDIITGGSINEGNGVYKSTDAGRTWRHLGLDATKQIPSMSVDPHDPKVVLLAAQGNVHAKTHERGVYRSTDGGTTWTQTLFVDDSTGAQKISRAFDTPNTVFATTVAHYAPPPPATGAGGGVGGGGRGGPQAGPTSTKLFKSTDGGATWTEISGNGLPARLTGKLWVAVANNSNAQRVYVIGDAGLYRSDDGGATWHQMAADDERIRNGQGGYNCGVYVDPQNPDVVYTLNTASYKSTDGGKTFTGFKGAPGGDDPQQMWIDPTNGQRMLFGYDQGAIVSLDGGGTWSSWYNQSTEQIYHLSIDNSVPYWVYGTQQDAGAIRTRIRGNLGAITPLDWNPVSGWEWGTIVPDPLDPNTVYASGSGILKISYPGEQWINVSPAIDASRQLRTTSDQPLVFAPWNKHMLIAAFQSVWTTIDGGAHWTSISPDLAMRSDAPRPANGGPPVGGAIQSMRASTVGTGTIWVGTNNGLIKVTHDGGKTWSDASIPGIPSVQRAEVLSVEPSHFDAAEAYAVLGLYRLGDYTPYVFRTRDSGKSWTRITEGLATNQPSGSFARVVRNDPQRRGLLFAGTESGMYVSFDDGDHWSTLSLNLPTTSNRDIALKDNDIVVSTYGRGFWVIDDYSMLRQVSSNTASEAAHLFKPGDVIRARRNVGADTPFPPEVPHALNPAEGVQIDYWLAQAARGDVTLDVLDASGALVRHMTSAAVAPVSEAARPPEPNFWIAPPTSIPAIVGGNRTHWDLRYDPPNSFAHSFEINANPGQTPPSPEGPVAIPGTYTLKLTVDGRSYSQTVWIKPDPHSPAPVAAIAAQHALQMKLLQGINVSFDGRRTAQELRDALHPPASSTSEAAARANALAAQLDTIIGGNGGGRGRGRGGQGGLPNFQALNGAFVAQLNAQDLGDLAPTSATLAAFGASCRDLSKAVATLEKIEAGAAALKTAADAIDIPRGGLKPPVC